jgi:hypothetical protein
LIRHLDALSFTQRYDPRKDVLGIPLRLEREILPNQIASRQSPADVARPDAMAAPVAKHDKCSV